MDAVPLVLVHDEHGQFEGLVTPADILEAVAGAFKSDTGAEEPAVPREDGSWLLSGSMLVDETVGQAWHAPFLQTARIRQSPACAGAASPHPRGR
jgi:CBS domain containing-hemolysin-like protein